MSDLISREEAMLAIHNEQTAIGWGNGMHEMDIHKVLLKVPTAVAEPVRHGRWILVHKELSKCSVCGMIRNIRTQFAW